MRRGWLAAAGTLMIACGGDAGVVQPAQRDVLAVDSEVLVATPDGRLIVEDEGRLLLVDPLQPEADPVVVGPAADVGEVHAAVQRRSAVLVLASGGTFVLRESAWVPSPLADALDGPIVDAAMVPTPTGRGVGDLWIATATSLYRVVEDRAERLALGEDLSEAELSVAGRPEGPSLWVRLPDRVLEVWRDRSGVIQTASLVLDHVPSAIAGDATTTGWMVLDGRLHSIGPDRQLRDHGYEVASLIASPVSDAIWLEDAEGTVRVHTDGDFYRVEAVARGEGEPAAVGPDGALYVAGDAVRRFAPRRFARIDGPEDGALLATERTFTITVEGTPEVEATIDGEVVEVATEPLRIELDPSSLEDGSHELRVRISHDDGTLPIEERRQFEVVSNATWSEDVGPLYVEHCAACHGPEGPANTRLDAQADWQPIFELILTNVEEGRMPLNRPPLTQRQIALIEAWGVSGFPE